MNITTSRENDALDRDHARSSGQRLLQWQM
jgi:hypothetical protein